MHLKAALQTFQRLPLESHIRFRLPEQPLMTNVATDMARRFDGIRQMPDAEDLEVVAARLLSAIRSGQDLPKKDWKKAAWCLWLGENWLVRETIFFKHYTRWLQENASRSVIGTLINAYLRHYQENDDSFREIGQWLSNAVAAWPEWIWAERQQKFGLFDADAAPKKIADAAVANNQHIYEFLVQIGLKDAKGASDSGLGIAVIRCLLLLLQQRLSSAEPDRYLLERCLKMAETEDAKTLWDIWPPSLLAESLLLPWREKIPAQDIQETIQQFILRSYKDLRLDLSRWLHVSGEAQDVMRRWLTRESLEQFIQVVDATTKTEQWQYRRAFWMSYFKANHINDAVVAFAPIGRDYAKMAFKDSYFGSIERGYYHQDQAVLLLRIGQLTIADWSHNGSCRIYLSNNPNTPSLSNRVYDGRVLRAQCDNESGDGTPHAGSENGRWQSKVADFIRTHTGIVVPRYQYMDTAS